MNRHKAAVFFLTQFLYFFTFWMVLAYLPLIFKSYEFTDRQIGFVIGLNSFSSILLVIPFGVLSDHFSPRRTLTSGAICFSGYLLLLIVLKDFYGMCVLVILGGVGAAAIRVILVSLYLKLIDSTGRGRKVALLHLAGYLGFGAGPLVGGYVYETLGAAFVIGGAFVLSVVIVIATMFLEDVPPVVFSFRDYRKDIKEPDALFLMALIFILGTHFGAEQSSISLFMKDTIGLNGKEIGVVFFALGIWMAVLAPVAGIIVDKEQRIFLLLIVGLLISSVFQFLTPFASTMYGLLVMRMIHTMGDTLAILESDVLTARFFPAARLGGNSGLLFCVRTTAIFVFAVFSGWLSQAWDYKMPFLVNGTMVFGFSIAAFFHVRRGFAGKALRMTKSQFLVLATRNAGKTREIRDLLRDFPVDIKNLDDFGPIPSVEEDGTTFDENAYKKASCTARILGVPALADDSGLEVEALGGMPGVNSARYAGQDAGDSENNAKLLKQMEGKTNRTATFVSVLSIAVPSGEALTYEGRCEGVITEGPKGENGFGYDPLFYYPALDKTFAQMTAEEKNLISHRARAMAQLKQEFIRVLTWIRQRP